MPKRTSERPESRSFSFRMPRDLFDDLEAIAKWRGVDVSALLNWILAEYRPILLKKRAEQEAATAEACASRVWAGKPSTSEALQAVRGLLRELQDEYARLSRQALDEDEREAA
jgi:hypothetical protein